MSTDALHQRVRWYANAFGNGFQLLFGPAVGAAGQERRGEFAAPYSTAELGLPDSQSGGGLSGGQKGHG